MSEGELAESEATLKAACERGDYEQAARTAFERYGREVLSFIHARLRCEEAGQEVFAMFAEDLWQGIRGFAWRCSMRCWVHVLARNAVCRYTRAPHRRKERNLPLSDHPLALAHVAQPRSVTRPHCSTEIKDKIRALRQRLSDGDQILLTLHIDRALPFREVALVVHEGPLDGLPLEREAARLRKRFERVKSELRRMATAEGLLPR